jgi:hypothetical protein
MSGLVRRSSLLRARAECWDPGAFGDRPPQNRPVKAGQPDAECLVPPETFGSQMVRAEQGCQSEWESYAQ